MRPCFVFNAATNDQPASLDILDEIGFWGVQAKDFKASLDAVSTPALNVAINSPGGDVFAGLAIYNMLRASGKTINVTVVGLAASAASVIAMAGDTITMPQNTFMMVHNPWTFAAGNADELREQADVLDKIGTSLVATYAAKTGMPDDDLKTLLANETWMTAAEAVEKGFATAVSDPIEAKAKFDLDRADLPESVKALFAAKKPTPPAPAPRGPVAQQVHEAVVAAGLSDYADAFALQCETVDAAKARIEVAAEIKALCTYAKVDALAPDLIRNSASLADARKSILTKLAEDDKHIDTSRKVPEPQAQVKTAKEIYAARNRKP